MITFKQLLAPFTLMSDAERKKFLDQHPLNREMLADGVFYFSTLVQKALQHFESCHLDNWSRFVRDKETFTSLLAGAGLERLSHTATNDDTTTYMGCYKELIFLLSVDTGSNHVYVQVAATAPHTLTPFKEFFSQGFFLKEPPEKAQSCFTLIHRNGDYDVLRIGSLDQEPTWENYPEDIANRFKEAMETLTDQKKSAGLLLLSGVPGTGKTHLIRAAIHLLPETCTVVLVPNTVSLDLTSPALLSAFLRCKGHREGQIVLILEDADNVLASREHHHSDAQGVGGLLNFADGILGQMLSIRVIATTNLNKLDIDAALRRPGRLIDHLVLGPLEGAVLEAAKKRLGVKSEEKSMTLAELYAGGRNAE